MRALKLMAWVAAHKALSAIEDRCGGGWINAARLAGALAAVGGALGIALSGEEAARLTLFAGLGGVAMAWGWAETAKATGRPGGAAGLMGVCLAPLMLFPGFGALGALSVPGLSAGLGGICALWVISGASIWRGKGAWGRRAAGGVAWACALPAVFTLGLASQAATGWFMWSPPSESALSAHAWLPDCEQRLAAAREASAPGFRALSCRVEGGRMGVLVRAPAGASAKWQENGALGELGELAWREGRPERSWAALNQGAGFAKAGVESRWAPMRAPELARALDWSAGDWSEALACSMVGWFALGSLAGIGFALWSAAMSTAADARRWALRGKANAKAWVESAEFRARHERRVLGGELKAKGVKEQARRRPRL